MPYEIKNLVRFSPILLALTFSACATAPVVGAVQPRPTISLAPSQQRLALDLPPGLPDAFELFCSEDVTQVDGEPSSEPTRTCDLHVDHFRTSVANGFAEGFHPYYTLVRENADLTLRFKSIYIEDDPHFAQRRFARPGWPAPHLIVHYAAQLEDREGKTVGLSFGTLTSIHPIGQVSYEEALTEALTMMLEQVARDCFRPLSIGQRVAS
jgi:hypothetical protein